MKVCVVGAGAVGGWIGARLATRGGAAVSALARGDTLRALQTRGWRLQQHGELLVAPCTAASDQAQTLGPQDLVVLTVKAPALASIAPTLLPLLRDDTIVLPAMNGVPWWFCRDVPGIGTAPLQSLDPDGAIAQALPQARLIGCVVHASVRSAEPGLSDHRMGNHLIVGEPARGRSQRAEGIAQLLRAAGFDVTHSDDIRRDIWFKLWGNMTMNPVSALTGATLDQLLADPLVRRLCSAAMLEAASVGDRLGCHIEQTPEDRHALTAQLGAFRSSMLQDVDHGRTIELDALLGAVCELGLRLDLPLPHCDALFGLTRLFARVRGIYPSGML